MHWWPWSPLLRFRLVPLVVRVWRGAKITNLVIFYSSQQKAPPLGMGSPPNFKGYFLYHMFLILFLSYSPYSPFCLNFFVSSQASLYLMQAGNRERPFSIFQSLYCYLHQDRAISAVLYLFRAFFSRRWSANRGRKIPFQQVENTT